MDNPKDASLSQMQLLYESQILMIFSAQMKAFLKIHIYYNFTKLTFTFKGK